ncbi:hypothetical protein JNB62_04370 [Microbacterium jejuense]|uniref:ACT domain-containing protein n=1 Tax=Microbacterium jejuense TaxID=1263637 RepID=A0ABS7HJC3_9MICO|nr:ACT domain-containing protein [Microbacterium jejuense]MBW9092913.1 hypothetical protein [Microbacterium jejuense]
MSIPRGQEADISLVLPDRPGALADFGDALGRAGVSVEGGGVWVHDGRGLAHFLVTDVPGATAALEAADLGPVTASPVVSVRLAQDVPGQLGAFTRRLGDAGIRILVQYSDHDHRLIVVVPEADQAAATAICAQWEQERIARAS